MVRTPIRMPTRSPAARASAEGMPAISSPHLVRAVLRVQRMDLQARVRLADEVHVQQPHLLYSVVVLHKLGASLQQVEVVLELLLVFHEAMKASGKAWP